MDLNKAFALLLVLFIGCSGDDGASELVPGMDAGQEAGRDAANISADGDVAALSDVADIDVEPDAANFDEETGLLLTAVNGTCVPERELFTNTYSCATVEGPAGDPSLEATAMLEDLYPARFDDPDLEWAQAQAASCSCICCHGPPGEAPHGPTGESRYVWSYQYASVWTDSANDRRLMGLQGFNPGHPVLTSPEQNHGFFRMDGGLPSNDHDRLKAFLDRELARRNP